MGSGDSTALATFATGVTDVFFTTFFGLGAGLLTTAAVVVRAGATGVSAGVSAAGETTVPFFLGRPFFLASGVRTVGTAGTAFISTSPLAIL